MPSAVAPNMGAKPAPAAHHKQVALPPGLAADVDLQALIASMPDDDASAAFVEDSRRRKRFGKLIALGVPCVLLALIGGLSSGESLHAPATAITSKSRAAVNATILGIQRQDRELQAFREQVAKAEEAAAKQAELDRAAEKKRKRRRW